ncbi:MAG: DTW domain-containing protein [Ghiorsea sp.]|nr:DTW domain-containing protein [Ghiorsea sp.]
MNIYLLTHSRELARKTNTGSLVKQVLGEQCTIFEWARKSPNAELLQRIQDDNIALLYPLESSQQLESLPHTFDAYILIDATWQEAQKMYNHSPYLHNLPKVALKPDLPSIYSLRRNQKETGLCTAECVSVLSKHHRETEQATHLNDKLFAHIKALS